MSEQLVNRTNGPDGWEVVVDMWRFLNVVFDAAGPVFERYGLHPKSLVVLALLDLTDSPREVADMLRTPPSSLSSMIKELETRHLVERAIHPQDRRRHVLRRTAEGDAALEEGKNMVRTCVGREMAEAPDDERHGVEAALRMVRRVADRDQT